MRQTTIVFDLDGTLVDTAPDLIHACNHAMASAGLGPVPEIVLRPQISFGSRQMILAGLAHHGRRVSDGDVDQMWQRFLDHYAANIAVDSRPFPGAVEALDRLTERGARLAVCTNKLEALSVQLLEALGLARRFAAICGRDTFPVCKPDARHLIETIRAAGGDVAAAIMIGDSDTDVTTARSAGVPVIGVTFGYTDIAMHALRPDAMIDAYEELADALAQLGHG